MKKIFFIISAVLVCRNVRASLQSDVQELKRFQVKMERELLKREAQELSLKKESEWQDNQVFKGGQTAQQALNPEMSIVGDFYGRASLNADHSTTGFNFRTAGFHFQSDLDPFSKTFIAGGLAESGFTLGEAFVDFFMIDHLNIRVGKFLQNFGIINRWHIPSLDQWDNPLAPSVLLGGKINQVGVSLHWNMPSLIASSNELFFEITNVDNGILFDSATTNPYPAALLRFLNFYDLGDSSYLNIGLSSIYGKNNTDKTENDRLTKLYGLDLTFLYEPVGLAHYLSFVWRSEFYYVDMEQIITGAKRSKKGYGLYSYIEAKISDRTSVGFRYDYVTPTSYGNEGDYTNQYVPYVTLWQSPWVKTRFQLNFKKEALKSKFEKQVVFQTTWAMGPHKHERY